MNPERTSVVLSDFPLFEGGPHYRAIRAVGFRASDQRNTLPLALLAMLAAWVPPAVLALAQGLFFRGATELPLGSDVALHLKLLLALPAFVLADGIVRVPLLAVLRRFLDFGIVTGASRESYSVHVASALRLRNARFSSVIILALAVLVSFLVFRAVHSAGGSNWHFTGGGDARRLSWAGWWHALVSYPLYLFILLRFFYRLALWWRLLWNVARLPLILHPAHPDRSGGIVFVGKVLAAFSLPAFALSAALSSSTAALMVQSGESLVAHKAGIACIAVFVAALFATPLLFFLAPLSRARVRALADYDALASAQQRAYEKNWTANPHAAFDANADYKPGPSDVADLNAVVAAIRSMRVIPVERAQFIQLIVVILLPFIALLSTEVPVGELLKKLLGLFL